MNFLQSCWKGPYQVLLSDPHVTKFQEINSWIHMKYIKKAMNCDWNCTSSGDLKVKIFLNWSRRQLTVQLPQDFQMASLLPNFDDDTLQMISNVYNLDNTRLCVLNHFSHVQLCKSLWTVAPQAPLSMGFSRQEYWSGLPCNQGIFRTQGLNPCLMSLAGGFFAPIATWKAPPNNIWTLDKNCLGVHTPNVTLISFQSVHIPSNLTHLS